MKRLLVVALACALALTVAGCGGGGGSAEDGTSGTGSSSGGSGGSSNAGIASPADLKAAIDRDHADAEWYGDVTDVTLETYLGAPVAVVHVAWSSTGGDYEVTNRKQTAINDAMSAYEISFAPNNALVTADGAISKLNSSGQFDAAPMEIVYALPAAPTTAAEVQAWLASVYGPGGLIALGANETWYAAIDSVEMEDGRLQVETRLAETDVMQRDLLNIALQTTGSPLLSAYGIRGTDGSYLGGSAGGGTPGMNGFFYPEG
jgi:hypothetical protein